MIDKLIHCTVYTQQQCIIVAWCYIPVDASTSKSAQKNKKRRAKKKDREATNLDLEKDEVNEEEPAPVVGETNPIELMKQKIEEAKLAKVWLVYFYAYALYCGSVNSGRGILYAWNLLCQHIKSWNAYKLLRGIRRGFSGVSATITWK